MRSRAGKGALPWIRDRERWAAVITRLLVPGGSFFLFEGHPLNWVWDPDARQVRLRDDASYFVREHAEHCWPQFDAVPGDELARLPNTFSVLMRRPAA